MSIEKVLYFDPQAEPHAGFCRRCGGSLYPPGFACLRCERRGRHDAAGAE